MRKAGAAAVQGYAAPADGQHRVYCDEEIASFIFQAMFQQMKKPGLQN